MNLTNQKQNFISRKKILNYFIFVLFIFYFFIGLNIYTDFGISIDEPFHRTSGYYWYLWILDNFFNNLTKLEYLKNSFNEMEWSQDFLGGTFLEYGVIFDLLAVFIENKLKRDVCKSIVCRIKNSSTDRR